jgi:hypothetical protein
VLNQILQSVNGMRNDQTLLRNEVREVKSNPVPAKNATLQKTPRQNANIFFVLF